MKIYCEVCGQEKDNIRNAKKLIQWTHNVARKPVTCFVHQRYRLYQDKHLLKYNPLTGQLNS